MKRVISLFLCAALLISLVPIRVSADEQAFFSVRIDAGNGVRTEKVLVKDGEIYLHVSSFEKYTRFRYDADHGTFLVQGQEYDKAFRIVHLDTTGKTVTIDTKRIALADCFGQGENAYLPLCQMLPILNAQIIAINDGVIQIVNNNLSLAELLYDFNINDYLFDPSEEVFKDSEKRDDYFIFSYLYDTVTHSRFDRLLVTKTGLCEDYQAVMEGYLSDNSVYYRAVNEKDHVGDLIESITGLSSAADLLNDVNEWFEELPQEFGEESVIDFLRSSNASDVFGEEAYNWVKHAIGEAKNLPKDIDISLAEIYEGISWVYSIATHVEDHRNMIDAVYGISDYETSLVPGASSQLGDVDPQFLAAKVIYNDYEDEILEAVGNKSTEIVIDNLIEAAASKTTVGFVLETVELIGEIIELHWEGDSGERALLMRHVDIMESAKKAVQQEFNTVGATENYRLALLLTLMASRGAYITMVNCEGGYEAYRDHYKERVETIEKMMMGLYLAAGNTGFETCENLESFAEKNRALLKDSGLLNELAEYELTQQLVPMIEYGILLGALDDSGVENMMWDLADGNGDGIYELYIEGNSCYSRNSQMFFDYGTDYVWSFTETGVAGSASWVQFAGENGFVFQRSYDTVGTQTQSFNAWHKNGWENLAGYGRTMSSSGEYSGQCQWRGENVTFDLFLERENEAVTRCTMNNPDLQSMEFAESADQICVALDEQCKNWQGLLYTLDQDLDGDGVTEHLYLINGAANHILDKMDVENEHGAECYLNYEDDALTIISVADYGSLTGIEIVRSKHYDLNGGSIRLYDDLVTINRSVCTCAWSNGYSDGWTYEIPQINLNSADIDAVNEKIRNDYTAYIHDCSDADYDEYPTYCQVDCDYVVKGDILSLVIEGWFAESDSSSFSVYNISLSKRSPVTDEMLIEAVGMTESEYRTHVKHALGSEFWKVCGFLSDANPGDYSLEEWLQWDEMLQNTIGDRNIDAAKPYFGENGDVYVSGDIYIPAGGGMMTVIVNLNEYDMAPNYAESLNYEKPEEQMRIDIFWDGYGSDGYLLGLDTSLMGTMDNGSWIQIDDWSVTYNENNEPVAYCASNWWEGYGTYYLYRVDGKFNFEVSVSEDIIGFGEMILESGVNAVVTYPDGRSFTYTLDEGVYKSYTGQWFWAPFSIDHGRLTQYDASWIESGGW